MEEKAAEFREAKRNNALFLVACARGYLGDVEVLIDRGASISATDKKGLTAVHFAAARGRADIVQFLWAKAADIDAEAADGRTPLHLASISGHTSIVKMLIDKGAIISGEDSAEDTALHCAARAGKDDAVDVLLRSGAKADVLNRVGLSPAGEALLAGRLDVVDRLMEWYALGNGGKGSIKSEQTGYLKERPGGFSVLHLVAGMGRFESVEWLLESDFVSIPDTIHDRDNASKSTPLHAACLAADVRSVELLLKAGALPEAWDATHRRPVDLIPQTTPREQVVELTNLLLKATETQTATKKNVKPSIKSKHDQTSVAADGDHCIDGEERTEQRDVKVAKRPYEAFLAMDAKSQRSAARRWATLSLNDVETLKTALQTFPGAPVVAQRAKAAADAGRELNLHKAKASLRSDVEFQADMAVPLVNAAVLELRQNPGLYDRYAQDARVASVLQKLRRVHAAIQANAQRTLSLDDVIILAKGKDMQHQLREDALEEERLLAQQRGHVAAAAAAAAAVSVETAEKAAQSAFETCIVEFERDRARPKRSSENDDSKRLADIGSEKDAGMGSILQSDDESVGAEHRMQQNVNHAASRNNWNGLHPAMAIVFAFVALFLSWLASRVSTWVR